MDLGKGIILSYWGFLYLFRKWTKIILRRLELPSLYYVGISRSYFLFLFLHNSLPIRARVYMLALPEVLRGRRARVPIFLLQAESFVVEELEGLLHLLAILQSLDLQVLLPLHRLG